MKKLTRLLLTATVVVALSYGLGRVIPASPEVCYSENKPVSCKSEATGWQTRPISDPECQRVLAGSYEPTGEWGSR